MLEVKGLTGGYGDNPVVRKLDFKAEKGTFFGILGPNGCGKSTLLKLITGVLEKQAGEVIIDGMQLETYDRKSLARKITLLPQQPESSFSYTVKDVIEMGRYPHKKGLFHFYDETDERKVNEVISLLHLEKYAALPLPSLSGGEQQRVYLARALVQEPAILLLDEPTNHLDISYQIEMMKQIKGLAREKGITIIAVLHDLNMASLFCDEILLMSEGEKVSLSGPKQALSERNVSGVYNTPLMRRDHPTAPKPLITFDFQEKGNWTNNSELLSYKETADVIKISAEGFMKTLTTSEKEEGFSWEQEFNFKKKYRESVSLQSDDNFLFVSDKGCTLKRGRLLTDDSNQLLILKNSRNEIAVLAIFMDEFLMESDFFRLLIKIGKWLGENPHTESKEEEPFIVLAASQRKSGENRSKDDLNLSLKKLITYGISLELNKEV
ncbi:ABC transporter ATP-binding protein [Evansella sp. LMS18]|uniref:ABC transporter ATP-binding protein n=1 Tax=Evansella sp. LMS18 TaxID=2924033 RepID=UPI0020D0C0A9|nr:ABC transporter ATP-binding protein [Evansella sp. LMS18]UTR09583.1 ABC transporter ATP-binding protein [Evansella sp. LMS18]